MTIRFALAGTGGIAAVHAQAITNQPDAQISAVVTTKADGAADFRRRFDVPHFARSVEELIDGRLADALVICTPNALHNPQAVAALRGGLHVFVEKPMAVNTQEADEMNRASRESGSLLMVGHCWRFDEEMQWLKEQAGRLGKIIRTKSYGVHANWGPSGWFTDRSLAGGGALADMGIHAIDSTRFLLGDPQPVSVYARVGRYYIQGDVDDTGLLLITWDNGATSYIETGWWQPHSDGAQSATQLYGQRGFGSVFPTYLKLLGGEPGHIDVVDPGFTFPRPDHGPQAMYDRQMAHFLDCIRRGTTPLPGGEEGRLNVRITDAAYESSRTGQVVFL